MKEKKSSKVPWVKQRKRKAFKANEEKKLLVLRNKSLDVLC